MKTFFLYFILSILLGAISAQAQTESGAQAPINEEKFSAIVQYSKNTKEEFKDLILFDQTIEVPKNAHLKLVTQKRCIAVFYENTKVQTPKDKVSPWNLISGSARWICPEEKIERVIYKESELQVQNGEFLLTNNQLYILRNNVKFDGKNLDLETLYTHKGKWLLLKNQPDPYDLWKKQEKYPAPIESERLRAEKPQDPYITRVFLTVAPTGFAGFYHHELENRLSDFEMDTHAFRLGTNFPWKNKSLLVFLEYREGESKDRSEQWGPPPIGYKSLKFEDATLGLGLRHNHPNSSSFYYYVGLTRQEMSAHTRPSTNEFYDTRIVYPYNVSAGGGYQKIFWAKNWISLVLGFDMKITQSLTQGKTDFAKFNGSNWNAESAVTSYSGLVYLGPVFNF